MILRFASLLAVVLLLIVPAQAQTTCGGSNWSGSYFNNADFAGIPVATSCDPAISFNWGAGAPASGVNADNFSVRWTSTQSFLNAGTYTFTIGVEDGVRFYVNGSPLINSMQDATSPRTLTANYTVNSPGATAFITLEMNNLSGNAQIGLNWALAPSAPTAAPANSTVPNTTNQAVPPVVAPPAIPATPMYSMGGGQPWSVEYFNNTDFAAPVVATESSAATGISRNYGAGAPLPGVNPDGWSARWTRIVDFPAGNYTFYVRSDDNSRVKIDNIEILATEHTKDGTRTAVTNISAGQHVITVEHLDFENQADIFLTWDPPIGTDLLPDGCNGQNAGINGNAAPCPGQRAGDVALQQTVTLSAVVKAGPLRFRETPTSTGRIMQMLHQGEQYTAYGRSTDNIWVQLDVNGVKGWSMTQFLTLGGDINTLAITDGTVPLPTTATTSTGTTASVQTQPTTYGVQARALGNMRLRSGPGVNYDRVGGLPWGTIVEVIGRTADGRWLKVSTNGLQGWSLAQWYQVTTGDLASVPVGN